MCTPMPSRYIRSLLLPLVLISSSCSRPAPQPAYDLIIAGGSVLDGDGTPAVARGRRHPRRADRGDRRSQRRAGRASASTPSGLTVAPGFIDMHNHSDYTILVEPKAESMIRQGVTTMVLGESRSAGPVKTGANDDPRSRADGVDGRLDDARRLLRRSSSASTWRRTSRRTSARSRCGRTSRATASRRRRPRRSTR